MAPPAGEYRLGPDEVTLSVRTARTGAAAKAGHDLLIHVTSWSASLVVGGTPADSSLELEADPTSLRVIEATGGALALGDKEKASIPQTIDDEVLKREPIEFRSTSVAVADGDRLAVEGELTIAGATKPVSFELGISDDGALSAAVDLTQSEWGIKPYVILFGALKVADEVAVVAEGQLPSQSR